MVECLTDNRNRTTAADVKDMHLINMVEIWGRNGSVLFMFEKKRCNSNFKDQAEGR